MGRQIGTCERAVLRDSRKKIAATRFIEQRWREDMVVPERDHVVLEAGQVAAVGAAAVFDRNGAGIGIAGHVSPCSASYVR